MLSSISISKNVFCSSSIHMNAIRYMSTNKPRRVVVTGIGAVTPMGNDIIDVFHRLTKGESGISTIVDENITKGELPVKVAATVGPIESSTDIIPLKIKSICSRFEQYAINAAHSALADSGFSCINNNESGYRAGVAIGSGIGCVEEIASASDLVRIRGAKRVSAYSLPKMLCNLAAGHVSILHNFMGPNHAVSTACATGSHAIGDAYRFIKYDDADVMVCGGAESGVSLLSLSLFSRIMALTRNPDPLTASRPFSKHRDGFVMSEGSCVFVLEELEHAKARGARIYAEVVGYGLSGDAHHVTSPPPDGEGASRSMASALRNANISPEEVDYINAHATSTPLGDRAEAAAISKVFNIPYCEALEKLIGVDKGVEEGISNLNVENASSSETSSITTETKTQSTPYVSSSKGALGHMLGAAGSMEAALCVLSIYFNKLIPTIGTDPQEIGEEFANLNILTVSSEEVVADKHRPIKVAVNNSFGFGGSNTSLVFKAYEEK